MRVTFQGFALEEGDGITLPEFAEVLANQSSETETYKFNDHYRIFLFESKTDPEYHTGLLVTTKDQKSFCELRNEGGKYKIKVSELEKGSQLMDFNFFILNKTSFTGMYQHYHESCSPLQFCGFLRSQFWKPERDRRCTARRKFLMHAGMKPAKAEREAETDFKRLLKFDLLYKPDGFKKILKQMSEIHGFQFEVSTKLPKHDAFLPQDVALKKETRRVLFGNKSLVSKIADSVSAFVSAHSINHGKVIAIDAHGIERAIYLEDNVAGFGEFDFDEVAAEIELDLEKFAQSWVIKRLLEAARANSALFG